MPKLSKEDKTMLGLLLIALLIGFLVSTGLWKDLVFSVTPTYTKFPLNFAVSGTGAGIPGSCERGGWTTLERIGKAPIDQGYLFSKNYVCDADYCSYYVHDPNRAFAGSLDVKRGTEVKVEFNTGDKYDWRIDISRAVCPSTTTTTTTAQSTTTTIQDNEGFKTPIWVPLTILVSTIGIAGLLAAKKNKK